MAKSTKSYEERMLEMEKKEQESLEKAKRYAAQKKELLKKCYIFALPTRYPNEGQPISILEAMGNGMFIITTDHAGIPDIVKDGVNGIVIFNEQNKKMIYKEMLYISVTDLKAICNNNRIICQSHFSEKNYLGKMKEIYNKW